MAVVVKIAAQGGVHRVRLEAPPTFDSLDALLRELYPEAGAVGGCRLARYTDEDGDSCILTGATFADFLETARTTGGGVCPVLRLEVLPPPLRAPTQELAGGSGAGVVEDAPCRLRAAGCLPRAEGGSRAASPGGSWLCLDTARDRGTSDGSWAWASCSSGGGSGRSSARRAPSPEPEGSWVQVDSREGSSERMQESGPSEASFDPVALNLAELRADDWESSASGCSESEPTAKALHLLQAALSSDQAGSQEFASRKEERAQEEGEAVEEALSSLLQPDVAAAVAPPPVPAAAGCRRTPAAPAQGRRVSAAAGAKSKGVAKSQRSLLVRAAWQGGKAGQLDAGLEKVVHMGHICDGCEACPLPGPRFTCRICRDFDLCWTCFMQKDGLPQPHNPSHHFQQVLWSEEVVPTCPGGCGFGVTTCSGHPTHCCTRCADSPGQHTAACQAANAHDDELDP